MDGEEKGCVSATQCCDMDEGGNDDMESWTSSASTSFSLGWQSSTVRVHGVMFLIVKVTLLFVGVVCNDMDAIFESMVNISPCTV